MISDVQLYGLAIFLGSAAMLLILLYHFLEVNSVDNLVNEDRTESKSAKKNRI